MLQLCEKTTTIKHGGRVLATIIPQDDAEETLTNMRTVLLACDWHKHILVCFEMVPCKNQTEPIKKKMQDCNKLSQFQNKAN